MTYVLGVVPFSLYVIRQFYNTEESFEAPKITSWNDVAEGIYPFDSIKLWLQNNIMHHVDATNELRLLPNFFSYNFAPTSYKIEIYPGKMAMLYQLITFHDF